jgi:hypothetical protein
MPGNIFFRGEDTILGAPIIGEDGFGGGTHKSLHIGTPQRGTDGWKTADTIEFGTFSIAVNNFGGIRPAIRFTALSFEFRLDNTSGSGNPGSSIVNIIDSKVGIGTTTPAAKLDVNGTSNFADNMNILSTKNQYLAASPTSDTVNDIRVRNDSGVLKTERCTVANATKGAGTWVDESKAEITTFENIVVNNWVADTTYVNFGYKADISLSGVISTDIIEIVFGHNEAVSGYYSPICLVDNGKITIYGKVNATITIPLIIKFKQ